MQRYQKRLALSDLIGLSLLLLFLAQYLLEIEWPGLAKLQAIESFKLWSGVLLFGILLLQWSLGLVRFIALSSTSLNRMLAFHNWVGAFSPLFFFLHSIHLGFALYIFTLSTLFLGNIFLGFLLAVDGPWQAKNSRRLALFLHIAISLTILVLAIFHIGVVFYYE